MPKKRNLLQKKLTEFTYNKPVMNKRLGEIRKNLGEISSSLNEKKK